MKTVVITGGNEGLGKAIAEILAKSGGYDLHIIALDEKLLIKTAEEVGAKYYVCDVRDYLQIEETFKKILSLTGQIDILINNAGVWIPEIPLEENSHEDIKKVIETNSLGVIYATKAVVPIMKVQKSGTIIQINSQGGLESKANRSVYYPSKWLVTGFTKSMQAELEPFNIKVTGIYPAILNTKLFKKQGVEKDMNRALAPKEVAKAIKFILETEDSTYIPELRIKKLGA